MWHTASVNGILVLQTRFHLCFQAARGREHVPTARTAMQLLAEYVVVQIPFFECAYA